MNSVTESDSEMVDSAWRSDSDQSSQTELSTTVPGILGAIGDTPLIKLTRYCEPFNLDLSAKLEACNPGGSAKDRPALQMISKALEDGEIDEGTTIVESSSGNMGIGLAQACRYFQLSFRCVVDPNTLPKNVALMKALGANIDVVESPHDGDFLQARLAKVNSLLKEIPNSFWPNQYSNPNNPLAHTEGTIKEIIEQTSGDLDYLFVATSSTGTAGGCRDYLRKIGSRAEVVAVDAHGSVLFGGKKAARKIPGLGAGVEPPLAEGQTFDKLIRVTDIECVTGCRRAAIKEAFLPGGSGGGVLEAIRSQAHALQGSSCVAILHDSGSRYLDTVYNDEWVGNILGATADEIAAAAGDFPGQPLSFPR